MNTKYSVFIGKKQVASGLTAEQAEGTVTFYKNNGDTAAHAAVQTLKHNHYNDLTTQNFRLRLPKAVLADQFFDYAGKTEDSIWLMDAYGTMGSAYGTGYFAALRLKEFDLFLNKEFGYTERVQKYIGLLADHADTAMTMKPYGGAPIRTSLRMEFIRQVTLGFFRSEDESKEYIGIFRHFNDLMNAVQMSQAVGTKTVIDLNERRIIRED